MLRCAQHDYVSFHRTAPDLTCLAPAHYSNDAALSGKQNRLFDQHVHELPPVFRGQRANRRGS